MTTPLTSRPELTIHLAAPRGFCAGVDRAIQIVEQSLEHFGAPIYVRHEIVHNRHVVESLEKRGAVFVDELEEVPDEAVVIFSAHGVPKAVPAEAERRNLHYIDATCPLVSKVHSDAERHARHERQIVMIGHANHPEVVGTMGQLPPGRIQLIESVADARSFSADPNRQLAYITQTTLSVDDTKDIISSLRQRFTSLSEPKKEDICYATTNRQAAVKAIAENCDLFFVVGAPNSSNSLRLVEVAKSAGCGQAMLIRNVTDIPWNELQEVSSVGISAGASAPEVLVREVLDAFGERFQLSIREHQVAKEDLVFKMPKELRADHKPRAKASRETGVTD